MEFSFNDVMYRQIDGVAMGSPLGPIFLGYCESQIPKDAWPELYKHYLDDTFSLFTGGREEAKEFLEVLNNLHPSLQFTMEGEIDGKLPFLDVLVLRDEVSEVFLTTIYRKPTFTGFHIRWDSFFSPRYKIAVTRSLAFRAKKICSSALLSSELENIKSVLELNGYPLSVVERIINNPDRQS